MLATFHLLFNSDRYPIGQLAPLLSWAIVVGGVYGVLRLGADVVNLLHRIAWRGSDSAQPPRGPEDLSGR